MVACLRLVPPPSSRPTLIRVWVSEPEKPWANYPLVVEFRIGDQLYTERVEAEFNAETNRLVDTCRIPEWLHSDVHELACEVVHNGHSNAVEFGGWIQP